MKSTFEIVIRIQQGNFLVESSFVIFMIKKLTRTVTYLKNFGFLDPLR